jgi:hypothetical protein
VKIWGKEILGGEIQGVAFQRFRVQDFGNPEGKEHGNFSVGNHEILKDVCGHRVGGHIGQKFAFRRLTLWVSGD